MIVNEEMLSHTTVSCGMAAYVVGAVNKKLHAVAESVCNVNANQYATLPESLYRITVRLVQGINEATEECLKISREFNAIVDEVSAHVSDMSSGEGVDDVLERVFSAQYRLDVVTGDITRIVEEVRGSVVDVADEFDERTRRVIEDEDVAHAVAGLAEYESALDQMSGQIEWRMNRVVL